jgi:hypothetical protein
MLTRFVVRQVYSRYWSLVRIEKDERPLTIVAKWKGWVCEMWHCSLVFILCSRG